MPFYRFYVVDCRRIIVDHAVAELDDDVCAQRHAEKMLVGTCYAGIEVWDGARLFYRKTKDRVGDG